MISKVLSVNLDSVYLTIQGTLNSTTEPILAAAKQMAQDSNAVDRRVQWEKLTEFEGVDGGAFHVQKSGVRGYPWVLKNARFLIKVSNRGGCRPIMEIDVLSSLLYERSLEEINVMVSRIGLELLEDDFQIKVRRADIAIDFASPLGFKYPLLEDVKTRAGKGVIYTRRNTITGMSWGKASSPMQIVIYSKSETLKADNKEWMQEIWAKTPRYDAEEGVTRIEFRFNRELLRELRNAQGESLNDISDLLGSVADLADYAISGEKPYFRVVDPRYSLTGLHRGHTERMDDAGWWQSLKKGFRERQTASQGRKRVQSEAEHTITKTADRCLNQLSKLAALMQQQGFHRATNPVRFAKDVVIGYFCEEKDAWPEMVNRWHVELATQFAPNPDRPAFEYFHVDTGEIVNEGPRPANPIPPEYKKTLGLMKRLMRLEEQVELVVP